MKAVLGPLLAAALAYPALAAERFPEISPNKMSSEQKAIMEAIASGPRKSASDPFEAWLVSPVLADRRQKVGEYVRFQSSLPKRLNEFVILLAGRTWNSQFEWAYHYPLALEAGVEPAVLDALVADRDPKGMSPEELRRDKTISDATFAATEQRFGKRGVIDLVAVQGYYDTVCMTLNVAQVPVPSESKAPPLQGAKGSPARSARSCRFLGEVHALCRLAV